MSELSVFEELVAFAEASEEKPTFADAVRIALAAKRRDEAERREQISAACGEVFGWPKEPPATPTVDAAFAMVDRLRERGVIPAVAGMNQAQLVERLKAAGYRPEPEGFLWVFSTHDLLDIAALLTGGKDTPK